MSQFIVHYEDPFPVENKPLKTEDTSARKSEPRPTTQGPSLPVTFVQEILPPYMELFEVPESELPRSGTTRQSQVFMLTDHRKVEVGAIRFRVQWNRYIFEPRENILLTSHYLIIIAKLLECLTDHWMENAAVKLKSGTNGTHGPRDAEQCMPAVNLTKMHSHERLALVKARAGK